MSLLLSAQNLTKSYAGKTLFKDLSFGIEEGDKASLVGPNGAGKSTLLKILAQRLEADKGNVVRRKGLRLGFLDQTPLFKKDESILDAILSKLDDPYGEIHKGYEWISKLELSQFDENSAVSQLSGGWQKRVAMARELVLSPDLLLLDEPTNHLDVKSILWLEEFIADSPFATLTVTHDRLFLQRTSTRILDLDIRNPNYLLNFPGDYLNYLEAKDLLISGELQREMVLKNTLRRETEWLRRGAKARQTKQKARIERAGDLKEDVAELKYRNQNRKAQIGFQEVEGGPSKLIELKAVSKTYGHRTLFSNLDLLIRKKTRLALLGENGAGKSTLLRVMMGTETPDEGTVHHAETLKFSFFEQNRESLQPQKSLLKNICPEGDYVNFQGQFVFARSYLERFLFSREQMDLPVAQLSGGEQSRLRIAQLMLKEASVLILDEPTNDLDVATLTVLEDALKEFPGAVILITHDRYFMDHVADEILSFDKDLEGHSKINKFSGYIQWEQHWSAYEEEVKAYEAKKAADAAKAASAAALSGNKGKLSFKEKFELENMESEIHKMEAELSNLQNEISQPENQSHAKKLQELTLAIAQLEDKIQKKYDRWAELEKK